MKFFALLSITLSLFLGGCNKGNPDQYLGEWHRVEYPNETASVTKEKGDKLAFVFKTTSGSFKSTREPIIGDLINDDVIFNAYEKATIQANGNMNYSGREYTK